MTEDVIFEYLRKNLKINISSKDGSYYSSPSIEVDLLLDGVLISTASCSPPEQRQDRY